MLVDKEMKFPEYLTHIQIWTQVIMAQQTGNVVK